MRKIGFIEGNKFYNKKQKLIGYLDKNTIKDKNGHILLKFDEHNDIFAGDEMVGFIYKSKIYFREQPIFEISEERLEVYTQDQKEIVKIVGNHEKINKIVLFAIATIFLEKNWWDMIYGYK